MRKLILLTTIGLLILNACNSSQLNPPNEENNLTSQPSNPGELVETPPENNIIFPTLTSTRTLMPLDTLRPSPTPKPDYQNAIVFVSDREGNKDIYRMDKDGSGITRLTESVESDSSPQWSYDKSRILFLSSIGVSNHLYSINPDGSEIMNMTPGATGISQCEWSPNAYQISCIALREGSGGHDVIIIDADSQIAETVYRAEGSVFDIAWSPEGDKIALATADVDGILVYSVTDSSVQEYELGDGLTRKVAWSNNGNRLAYSFGPRIQGVFATLYTVKKDFRNPRKWIDEGGPEWVQSFSPGDEYILLESSRAGHSEIFIFDLEAKTLIQLTNTDIGANNPTSANGYPVYSEDGSRIVFVSIQEGQSDIFVMEPDGTEQVNLTNHPAGDWEPDW